MKGDPKKLLDDLVASAAGDEPSEPQLARLSARLGPLLGPPGGGPGQGGAGAAGGGAIGKWLLGATAAAVVGGGGYVAYRAAHHEPAVVAAVAPADAGARAIEIADAAPVTADAAPIADAGARHASHRPSPEEALAEETRLLGRAQSALAAGDGRGALRWVDRHTRRFARGALAEERERLAIEALVVLGRRAAAETRAQAFRRRFPRSVQWPRIRELLDGRH
jgi:hypothetical protein